MPTVLLIDGFAFKIQTNDHIPPHVHVWKAGREAKLYLDLVRPEAGYTLSARDLARAAVIVQQHQAFLMAEWGKYHG
jgi:hypothetical protein